MDSIWPSVEKEAASIDWKNQCLDPSYVFESPVREHRYLEPVRELPFDRLEREIEHISDRVVRFYRSSAPIAAKWAGHER